MSVKVIYRSFNHSKKQPIFSIFFKDYIDHRYSLKALKSVMIQTTSSEDYEVILLTDQEDITQYKDIMDKYGVNYTIVVTGLIRLGESYVTFLEFCNGTFVCPIDNDDTWVKEKLETLKGFISKYHDISFIKGQVSVISESGNNFYTKLRLLLKMNIPIRTSNRYYILNTLKTKKILGRSLWHNASSMVIRTSILVESKDILRNIFAMDDPYLFFFGLSSGGTAIFMDKFLSYYLVRNNSKTSRDRYSSNYLEISYEYERFIQTFDKKYMKNQNSTLRDLYLLSKSTSSLLIFQGITRDSHINWTEVKKALKISINYRMHNFIFLYLYSLFRPS